MFNMNPLKHTSYTTQAVWDIFISDYRLAATFDPEVEPDACLNNQTTIAEWIDICDLIPPKKLAQYYYRNFELTAPYKAFESFLCQSDNTLLALCAYIARYATRPAIQTVSLGGKACQTASIFMTLKKQLAKAGADTTNLRPGTKLTTYIDNNGLDVINTVNKIAPNTLTEFIYEKNTWEKAGNYLIIFGALYFALTVFICQTFKLSPLWFYSALIPFTIGWLLEKIGTQFPPEAYIIGHCENFRALIYRMQQRLDSAQ